MSLLFLVKRVIIAIYTRRIVFIVLISIAIKQRQLLRECLTEFTFRSMLGAANIDISLISLFYRLVLACKR